MGRLEDIPKKSPGEDETLLELPGYGDKFQLEEDSKDYDEEEMLEGVRNFGPFQYIQLILLFLLNFFMTMHNINYIFAADDIEYRCAVPECEKNSAIAKPTWWPNNTDHRCSRPVLKELASGCSTDAFSNETAACDRWIYENENSVVHAFDMACKPWMRTTIGTVHNFGLLIGNPILGYFSDRYGRKVCLILGILGIASCGIIKTFSVNYYMYITFELLEATIGANAYMATFVLAVELMTKNMRPGTATYLSTASFIGKVTFSFLVQYVPYWKTWIRVVYGPALSVVLYFFLLSESLRWMVVNGRVEQAKKTVLKMAKWNRTEIEIEKLNQFDKFVISNEGNTPEIKEIFSSSIILRRLAIASFWWVSIAFVYYGITINSVGLPGNKHTNFMMLSVANFIGDLIAPFNMNYFGRKMTCLFSFLVCGSACVASGLIPESMTWLSLTVFLLGCMAAACTFDSIYIYTSELFPTSHRASLMSFCNMIARIGSTIAPQTPLLKSIIPCLHLFIFGAVSLLAAFLMTLTPETLNQKLPDTMKEAEQLSKKPEIRISSICK